MLFNINLDTDYLKYLVNIQCPDFFVVTGRLLLFIKPLGDALCPIIVKANVFTSNLIKLRS